MLSNFIYRKEWHGQYLMWCRNIIQPTSYTGRSIPYGASQNGQDKWLRLIAIQQAAQGLMLTQAQGPWELTTKRNSGNKPKKVGKYLGRRQNFGNVNSCISRWRDSRNWLCMRICFYVLYKNKREGVGVGGGGGGWGIRDSHCCGLVSLVWEVLLGLFFFSLVFFSEVIANRAIECILIVLVELTSNTKSLFPLLFNSVIFFCVLFSIRDIHEK